MDRITRRQVAQGIGRHPDTVTRLLPEGLAYAIVEHGGRGREMLFDRFLVERWFGARECRRDGFVRPCSECWLVLEDAKHVAEHLLETRHGTGECEECIVPGREPVHAS